MSFNVNFNLSWLIGISSFCLFCGKRKYVTESKNVGPRYISDLIFCCPLPPRPLLRTFQWLSISIKIKAKALKLAYMSLQEMVPCYCSNLISNDSLAQPYWLLCCFWTCQACSHLRVYAILSTELLFPRYLHSQLIHFPLGLY